MITKINDEVIDRLISGEVLIHKNEHFTCKYVYDESDGNKQVVELKSMSFNNGLYNETIVDYYELNELEYLKDTLNNMVIGGSYAGTLEWMNNED